MELFAPMNPEEVDELGDVCCVHVCIGCSVRRLTVWG